MKSRPILFSAPMVRALLAGTKTQTRRTVKFTAGGHIKEAGGHRRWHPEDANAIAACPYGAPGDRLWVRETWGISHQCDDINHSERIICYRAGGPWHVATNETDALRVTQSGQLMQPKHFVSPPEKWKPSIFMRPWMSRLTLEITAVRVERLQDISEADAVAEGVTEVHGPDILSIFTTEGYACDIAPNYVHGVPKVGDDWMGHKVTHISPAPGSLLDTARDSYRKLWGKINGPGSWAANPWVWVIEFRRVEGGAL